VDEAGASVTRLLLEALAEVEDRQIQHLPERVAKETLAVIRFLIITAGTAANKFTLEAEAVEQAGLRKTAMETITHT
jgi:hypothetical protein